MTSTDWMRTIHALQIDDFIDREGVYIERVSANRFMVRMDGIVKAVGGNRSTVDLVRARVVSLITGKPIVAPCSDCGRPREVLSYCRTHYNMRVNASRQKARAR